MTSQNEQKIDLRSVARHSINLIKELKNIICKVDSREDIGDLAVSIKDKTIHLGNSLRKIKTIPKKNPIYNLRCEYAHSDGTKEFRIENYETWKTTLIEALPNIEPELEKIASQFSQNEIKYQFETSSTTIWGTEENRKSIIDALEDSFNYYLLPEDRNEFPKNSGLIQDIAENFNSYFKYYASNHSGLSENIQTDILTWADETKNNIEFESIKYFVKEQLFLEKLKAINPNDFFNDIVSIEEQYNAIESVQDKFDMQKYLELCNSDIENIKTTKESKRGKEVLFCKQRYFYALLKALQENFNARKSAFEQNLIDEKRKKFLKELYEKIENFRKLEEILQPFINDLSHGYLWDMSNTSFRNLGFDILQKYNSLLNNDKALQELAELLGKQSITSHEVEEQIIQETVIKSEYHPKPAQSGNIVGLEYSNEVSRILPSETALLTDPDLENLFYLRFVEKKLLSYQYSQNASFNYKKLQEKKVEVAKDKDVTGPIIICVDTSGSMQGTPEQTAKIATFALAKIAIRQHRKCFLISFSTGIETLDMSDFKKSNALEMLVNFLNKSFNGGTDATPALAECLLQLKTENYKNADVLMISDFVMSSLPENLLSQIEAEQERGTSFYSLVIGQSANNKTIQCFNENITYDPYNESSRKEFYRKIRQIAVEKKMRNS